MFNQPRNLVKAGPRCLAGEFGHGLSSLQEPQGQNQGALGRKSGGRSGSPRSSGIGMKRRRRRILKMGEIFFPWIFPHGQIMHIIYHYITL